MKKFLPLLALLLCACGQKPAEAPKISIFCDHIWTVARQEGISFREAATKIREIGYDGADVRVLQNPDELRILDSLGFGHSCAIADIDYGAGEQPEMEALALSFLETYGYDRLLLVTGLMPEGSTAADRDAARQRIAAFAKRVTDKGFCIMVEDFDNPRSLCYNIAGLDSLFTLAPSLGHVFDTGNYLFAGDDALVAYEQFRNRIGHVHLKDRVAPDDMHCVPAGSGCIPVAEIVHKLVGSGYGGWLTVEQYGSRQMLADSKAAYANVTAILKGE